MPDNPQVQVLAEMIKASHRWVLMALGEGLDNRQLGFQVIPGGSTIHWLAGHLAWTNDSIVNGSLGLPARLPANYPALFSIGSKASPDASGYPPLAEILDHLGALRNATLERLETLPDSELAREFPEGSPFRNFFGTIGGMLRSSPMHEAYHAGQITLLRRAQGLPSAIGV